MYFLNGFMDLFGIILDYSFYKATLVCQVFP